MPSFTSYQLGANIISPSTNSMPVSKTSVSASASLEPPVESPVLHTHKNPLGNDNNETRSSTPPESREAQWIGETHSHIPLPMEREEQVPSLPLADRLDNSALHMSLFSPLVGPSAARPPPPSRLQAGAPSLSSLRSPIQKRRQYVFNKSGPSAQGAMSMGLNNSSLPSEDTPSVRSFVP